MNEIKFIKGNIFTSKAQTLVNTVNCMGVMGAGIALEFKYRYPAMFEQYTKYCEEKYIQIGKLWIYNVPETNAKVLNFPTKFNWKQPSKYEYLEKGLSKFVETYKERGITSIAFPLLGALNGGLEPEKVIILMEKYLSVCEIPIEIYEYDGQAKDDLIENFHYAFMYQSLKELTSLTGLKINVLKKIKTILEEQNIHSLIQLHKAKGIGEETLKSCFQFAMKLKAEPQERIVVKQTMFNTNQTTNKGLPKTPKIPTINTAINGYGLSEKVLLTGLDVQTIEKIENKEEDVSIKAIKTYCLALNINLKEFIVNNYVGIS